ncbi:MAG: hypothetical protein QOF98_3732 [Streptomyces sp.]|nr:hypothetical protein [Streptomyces sp.]
MDNRPIAPLREMTGSFCLDAEPDEAEAPASSKRVSVTCLVAGTWHVSLVFGFHPDHDHDHYD